MALVLNRVVVNREGAAHPRGALGLRVLAGGRPGHHVTTAELLRDALADGLPRRHQATAVRQYHYRNLPHLLRGLRTLLLAHTLKIPTHIGALRLALCRHADGAVIDLGLVSLRVVTNNGVATIVDALDNSLADATIKYHGLGTGGTAEAATDSALVTELTTQYNPDSTRATGTFSQPAANQSQSVATNTVDASVANTEHGVFSQAATGGGVLLDRTLYTVVNLASADSLQSTYTLTLTSGG